MGVANGQRKRASQMDVANGQRKRASQMDVANVHRKWASQMGSVNGHHISPCEVFNNAHELMAQRRRRHNALEKPISEHWAGYVYTRA